MFNVHEDFQKYTHVRFMCDALMKSEIVCPIFWWFSKNRKCSHNTVRLTKQKTQVRWREWNLSETMQRFTQLGESAWGSLIGREIDSWYCVPKFMVFKQDLISFHTHSTVQVREDKNCYWNFHSEDNWTIDIYYNRVEHFYNGKQNMRPWRTGCMRKRYLCLLLNSRDHERWYNESKDAGRRDGNKESTLIREAQSVDREVWIMKIATHALKMTTEKMVHNFEEKRTLLFQDDNMIDNLSREHMALAVQFNRVLLDCWQEVQEVLYHISENVNNQKCWC